MVVITICKICRNFVLNRLSVLLCSNCARNEPGAAFRFSPSAIVIFIQYFIRFYTVYWHRTGSMAMNTTRKGCSVELRTFMSYGKSEVIGHKVEEKDGKKFVNMIWCKVCARNKEGIVSHPSLHGDSKVSLLAFINGTIVVTKYQVR